MFYMEFFFLQDIVSVHSPQVCAPLSGSPKRNQMSAKRRLLECFKYNPKPLLGFKCTTPSASGWHQLLRRVWRETESFALQGYDTDGPRTSPRTSLRDYMFNLLLISKLSTMTEPICRDPAQVSVEQGGGVHSHVPNGISMKPEPRVHRSRQHSPLREGTLLHPDTSHSRLLLSLQATG